ncbi:MAG: hypothetical protein K6L80_12530 [Agarilytica sp.]
MLQEGSASVVKEVATTQRNNRHIEMMIFHDGRSVALFSDAIGIYRDRDAVLDPLGNGLINIVALPKEYYFEESEAPWVQAHRAGFVQLYKGLSLLILPNDIRLYRNSHDALRNTDPIIQIPFDTEDK